MESQDVSTEVLIKFWPWLEANRKRLIIVGTGAAVVLLVWYFYTTRREQKAVDAGVAYTQLQLSLPANPTPQQVADAFLKLAGQYAGTLAADRAQLQAAAALFEAGRYADAQVLFQKFLNTNDGSPLAAAAQLGEAASLEAAGKLADAATAYLAVVKSHPESNEALSAKFALGRVLEAQGQLTEATSYYQEVARAPLAGTLGSEAGLRLSQISAHPAASKPAGKS